MQFILLQNFIWTDIINPREIFTLSLVSDPNSFKQDGALMRKTICSILLMAIAFSIILSQPVHAADKDYTNYEKAIDLKMLGLFMGNEAGFDLGRAPTRIEGACMLVRLLGKNEEANSLKLRHPFTDVPGWAANQIGYLYQNGLTTGIGNNLFGSNQLLSVQQYVTFILRSLGYDDKKGDFKFNDALDKATLTGLLTKAEASAVESKNPFLRDDLVGISYSALKVKLKGTALTLLDKLVTQDKAVSKVTARILGLYTSDLQSEIGNITDYTTTITGRGYVVKDSTDLFKLLRKTLYETTTNIKIDFSSYSGNIASDFKPDLRAAFSRAVAAVELNTGVENFSNAWAYTLKDYSMDLSLTYYFSENEFRKMTQWTTEAVVKAKHAIMDIIKPGMTEYDKELAIHDYIINNTRFDNANYFADTLPLSSYNAYGCLVLGASADAGYAKAVKLICDLLSMECIIVEGQASDHGIWDSHSWNIVEIEGKYYHLDVAFDDEVSDKIPLTHHHFNLTDNDIGKLYKWDNSKYPVCSSTEFNYYYKTGLIVNSVSEFEEAVQKAIGQKRTQLELRIRNYKPGDIKDLPSTILKSETVSKYEYSMVEDYGIIAIMNLKYW